VGECVVSPTPLVPAGHGFGRLAEVGQVSFGGFSNRRGFFLISPLDGVH
jgi:hypothetical protein